MSIHITSESSLTDLAKHQAKRFQSSPRNGQPISVPFSRDESRKRLLQGGKKHKEEVEQTARLAAVKQQDKDQHKRLFSVAFSSV